MDAYDAEASHEYEGAPEFEKGLREPVGTHRTKAGLGAGQKQGPVGAHTTAGEVLKSVGKHQAEKMMENVPPPAQRRKRADNRRFQRAAIPPPEEGRTHQERCPANGEELPQDSTRDKGNRHVLACF